MKMRTVVGDDLIQMFDSAHVYFGVRVPASAGYFVVAKNPTKVGTLTLVAHDLDPLKTFSSAFGRFA
jgi:hypothetical protein